MTDVGEEDKPLFSSTIDKSIRHSGSPDIVKYEGATTDFMKPYEMAIRAQQAKEPGLRDRPVLVNTISKEGREEREALDLLYSESKLFQRTNSLVEQQKIQERIDGYVEKLQDKGWTPLEIRQEMNQIRAKEAEAEKIIAGFTPKPDINAQ